MSVLGKRNATDGHTHVALASLTDEVKSGGRSVTGQSVTISPEHRYVIDGRPTIARTTLQPVPDAASFENNTPFTMQLERNSIGLITDGTLEFNVTFSVVGGGVATDNSCMAVPFWNTRLEYWSRSHNKMIQRIPDQMQHLIFQTMGPGQQEMWMPWCNYSKSGNGLSSARQFRHGENVRFRIPLLHHWLDNHGLDMQVLKTDIELRFFPKGSIFRYAQSTGTGGSTVALNSVQLIADSQMMTMVDRSVHRERKLKVTHQQNFVEFRQYSIPAQPLIANKTYKPTLEQFNEDSAGLIIFLRKTDAIDPVTGATISVSSGRGAHTSWNLGNNGTIDHESISNTSLYGDGVAVPEDYQRFTSTHAWFTDLYQKSNSMYLLPFTNNLDGVLSGVKNGYYGFKGTREFLNLTTGDPAQTCVATYALEGEDGKTAPVDSGTAVTSFRLVVRWKGKIVCSVRHADTYTTDVVIPTVPIGVVDVRDDEPQFWEIVSRACNASEVLTDDNVQLAFCNGLGFDNTVVETDGVYAESHLLRLAANARTGVVAADLANVNVQFTDLTGQPLVGSAEEIGLNLELSYPSTTDFGITEGYLSAFTPGVRGFLPGNYVIELHSIVYKRMQETQGVLLVQNL